MPETHNAGHIEGPSELTVTTQARGGSRWSLGRRLRASSVPLLLLGIVMLTGAAAPDQADANAPRSSWTCGYFAPMAKAHIDERKLCSRIRREVLHSLKKGKDPDWEDVIRDSIPRPPGRHPRPEGTQSRTRDVARSYDRDWLRKATPQPAPSPHPPSPNAQATTHQPAPPRVPPASPFGMKTPPTPSTATHDDSGPLNGRSLAALALVLISGVLLAARFRLVRALTRHGECSIPRPGPSEPVTAPQSPQLIPLGGERQDRLPLNPFTAGGRVHGSGVRKGHPVIRCAS